MRGKGNEKIIKTDNNFNLVIIIYFVSPILLLGIYFKF